jgi:pimeloyl-ACP methyl ester carboxylesterase
MFLYTILIAVGLVLIMGITWLVGRAQQKNATARFSRKFGLDVPAGMEMSIRASVMARHYGALIGTAITETVAVVLLLSLTHFQLLASWWCLFAAYLVGAGVGSAIAILLAERTRERGLVRVARTSAVSVVDYVSPFQSAFARFCVIIAVVGFAGDWWLAVSESPEYLSIVSGILVGLAIVLLVSYEVVARRYVSKGALAGSTLELAWDDALRAYALSNLNLMVALVPLYSFIGYDTLLVANPSAHVLSLPMFTVYTGLFPIAATVGILALVAVMTRNRSRQYFLRRLWPSLAVRVDDNVNGVYTSMMG